MTPDDLARFDRGRRAATIATMVLLAVLAVAQWQESTVASADDTAALTPEVIEFRTAAAELDRDSLIPSSDAFAGPYAADPTTTTEPPTTTTTSTTVPPTTVPPTTAPPTTVPPTTAAPTTVPPTTAPPTTQPPAPTNTQEGQASWYDYHEGTCAHKTLAFGTIVTVVNKATGASTTCRVADRGPFIEGRIIDLERRVFAQIADPSQGVIDVRIHW